MQLLFLKLIERAERRLGRDLDYVREIARVSPRLLMRYNRIFSFLDPVRHVPKPAYHVARIRGALASDCGTCAEIEVNLARSAGVAPHIISACVQGDAAALGSELAAVMHLSDAVTRDRTDDSDARAVIVSAYGEVGLIELSFTMNGAAMVPGIKRAMGYSTACDADLMARLAKKSGHND